MSFYIIITFLLIINIIHPFSVLLKDKLTYYMIMQFCLLYQIFIILLIFITNHN